MLGGLTRNCRQSALTVNDANCGGSFVPSDRPVLARKAMHSKSRWKHCILTEAGVRYRSGGKSKWNVQPSALYRGSFVDNRTCVCNGQNGACRYCDGRRYVPSKKSLPGLESKGGIIPSGRAGKRPAHFSLRWSNRQPLSAQPLSSAQSVMRSSGPFTKCPRCSVPVLQKNLDRHIRKCKSSASIGAKAPLPVQRSLNQSLNSPPNASPALNPARIHPSAHETNNPLRAAGPSAFVICPICEADLKRENLGRHNRKCHCVRRSFQKRRAFQNRPMQTKDAGTSKNAMPPTSRDGQRSRAYDQVSGRDRLDRTKNYGFPSRELGRYGSHSAHDGFDDESGPG